MTRWLATALMTIAVVVGLGVLISAHEIGTTRVEVRVDGDRHYTITVVTDAAALLEKLESVDGQSDSVRDTADPLEARLRAHAGTFASRVSLTFDDGPATPAVEMRVPTPESPDTPAVATVVLTGQVPSGATRFGWQYGWTFASYALTTHSTVNDPPSTVWLDGTTASGPVPLRDTARATASGAWLRTARQYLALGFTHILPLGPDHVLFVLGLFLLNNRPRALLAQVSAFTIAHSLTLGLSMYGLLAAPSRVVEPAIAISIAYVAVENVLLSELKAWRLWLVFGCGLLHGLGFAGVLQELGLPREQFIAALLSFNVGVEMAQLTVIAVAFAAVGAWFGHRSWYRAWVVVPASVAIACIALVWTVERIVG